uniref:Uncharacterized protein n=1 Tax=Rhizophora mucronata TaxID=61149 RepID=A0A2P2IHX7_RHIMU
MVSGIALSVLK